VNDAAFEIISVVVPTKHDFAGACIDKKQWLALGHPTLQKVSWKQDIATSFNYPHVFTIDSESRKYKLEMRLKETGSHAIFDGGMDDYKCPILWSWNYVASGTILQKKHGSWEKCFNFDDKPASVYFFDNFDFVAMAKQAHFDISDYEHLLQKRSILDKSR
jgi:hypothetical protein